MNFKAVLSTLVIVFFSKFAATTAASHDQPRSRPWLAVMTYPCRRSANNTCIGVVLNNNWVLTTASCLSKCRKAKTPLQLSVYVNIPSRAQGRLASSVRMGSKVNGSLVWQHPDFNSNTFANNLALVQLGCHTHSLEKLSLATNCSSHGNQQIKFDGYIFATRSVIKIENTKTDKTKCFAKEGTGTWYHLDSTLQMLTTTSRSSCMETSICNNSAQLISVVQGNKLNCNETLSFKINDTAPKPIINDTAPTIEPSIIHNPDEDATVMLALTSTEMSTSIPVSSLSLTSSVAANTLTITTPTKTPTSGCQLSIENGVATPLKMPGYLLITYTCNVGYRFKTGTRPIKLGCTNGEMLFKPPPCELIACPPVEPIANGQVVVSGSGLGESATYKCNEGYVLFDGYTVRRCMENLEWSGNAGICKRACPIPDALVCNDDQTIIFPSAFKYGKIGDSASYRPKQGYTLVGELPVCQPNSTWSTPPKCLKLCDETQEIANAMIVIHRNASNYTRTIICNDGYEVDGIAERQHCVIGQWTPNFNKCKKTCASIVLDNGIVKPDNYSTVVIKCEEGFHLVPFTDHEEFYSVCFDGQWSPSIPRCVEDK